MQKSKDRAKRESGIRIWIALGLSLILIGSMVAAAVIVGGNRPDPDEEPVGSQTPANLTSDGSFRILGDGSVDTEADESSKDGLLRVQVFFDPMCPGCGYFERAVGDRLLELTKNGEIDLYLTPVSFLDRTSSDFYSTRAVNALVTVGSESPEHFYDFFQAIYSEDFQPHEGVDYVPVTDADLSELAQSVGVPAEVANSFAEGNYGQWIASHSQASMNRTDLFPQQFATPGVFIGGFIDPETSEVTGATQVQFGAASEILKDFNTAYANVKGN